MIRRLTLDWWMTPRHQRQEKTQWEWAAKLGIRQSYVAKMVSAFNDPNRLRELASWAVECGPVTLEDLHQACERRKRARAQLK